MISNHQQTGPLRGKDNWGSLPWAPLGKGPILTHVTIMQNVFTIDSYPYPFLFKLHILTLQSLLHSIIY